MTASLPRAAAAAALVATWCATIAQAAISEHEITSLPGWEGALPSKMYSGYIPVGKTAGVPGHIHYWFIESQGNPAKDPVVYWTNGGPGGSGINAGLLGEMGVFQLNEDSLTPQGVSLIRNQFAWSTQANMIYVSQPKGVGFSYCDDLSAKDCVNNDVTAAQDAYDFFSNFFSSYPEFASNDFYLTAESYGGIYIPMFMNEMDTRGGFPNLKGAAIGDGCWGTSVGTCNFTTGDAMHISAEFFKGHGMYSQTLYETIKEECGDFSDDAVVAEPCASALKEMNDAVGTFDVYNIYDTCSTNESSTKHTHQSMVAAMSAQSVSLGAHHSTSSIRHPQLVGAALNDYPCGGDAVGKWLSQDSVVQALHVKSGLSGMTYNWGPYNVSGDLRPLYKKLAQKYHLLIYSGDTDACVPFVGTETWTRELGFEVKDGWKPWLAQHMTRPGVQRAGYRIKYETPQGGQFTFATVQGAGHMVPTYKPHFALTMLQNFLSGEF